MKATQTRSNQVGGLCRCRRRGPCCVPLKRSRPLSVTACRCGCRARAQRRYRPILQERNAFGPMPCMACEIARPCMRGACDPVLPLKQRAARRVCAPFCTWVQRHGGACRQALQFCNMQVWGASIALAVHCPGAHALPWAHASVRPGCLEQAGAATCAHAAGHMKPASNSGCKSSLISLNLGLSLRLRLRTTTEHACMRATPTQHARYACLSNAPHPTPAYSL